MPVKPHPNFPRRFTQSTDRTPSCRSTQHEREQDLIYETSATAPPEALHQYLMACRDDGFHAARRRLRDLLDKYGLAGTDFVNQLHRELYTADFLSEEAKLDMTEWMAEVDYRLVEGGGEQIQLDALTARLVTHLKA